MLFILHEKLNLISFTLQFSIPAIVFIRSVGSSFTFTGIIILIVYVVDLYNYT